MQPEGPGGSGLLRLLYGLQGQALAPEAVKLAAKVDEQMQDGLLSVKAYCAAGDADGLVALTATNDMAWTSSSMLVCAVAEGLIAMKRISEALSVLDRLEQEFPRAVRPKQLRGLALARSGQTMKAQLVLGKLYAAGQTDPETLGILAGTWMDRFNQTGEKVFLLKSRDLYRQAFEGTRTTIIRASMPHQKACSQARRKPQPSSRSASKIWSVTRQFRTTTGRRRRSQRHSSSRKTSTTPPPFMVRRFWRRRLTAAVTSRATLKRNSCLRR